MRPVIWLTAASVLSAVPLSARFGSEIWLGMIVPLAVMIASWLLMRLVYRTQPARLTAVMIGAFAGKLIVFGAYVWLAIVVLGARPVPFALSLTGYFVALHLIEALLLKRLFV